MKILIASSIDPAAKQRLCAGHDVVEAINAPEDVLVERIADREAVIFRSGVQISERVMSAAPDLKLLVRAGSGLDNVDVWDMSSVRGFIWSASLAPAGEPSPR